LVPHQIETKTAEATAENASAPPKLKAAYFAPLCRYIAYDKDGGGRGNASQIIRAAQKVFDGPDP
jgi:hypothetical protein